MKMMFIKFLPLLIFPFLICYKIFKGKQSFFRDILVRYAKSLSVYDNAQVAFGWSKPLKKFDECILLANGPSAAKILAQIKEYANKADIFTVNEAYSKDIFFELRPRGHVFLDSFYFLDPFRLEKSLKNTTTEEFLRRINNSFEKVDWDFTLYVPSASFLAAQKLYSAPNLKIAAFPTQASPNPLKESIQLIDNGVYGLEPGNVSIAALQIILTSNYKKVWLAGLDLNYFNIVVDENCRLVRNIDHFYQTEATPFQHWITLAQYCRGLEKNFAAFDIIKKYAEIKQIEVVNLSMESFLQSFPKGFLGAESLEWKARGYE